MTVTRLVQFIDRWPLVDLAWGHPDPSLLPLREVEDAAVAAARVYGGSLIEYGFAAGPSPLVEWAAEHVAATDGRRPTEDEIVITAGSSWALDLVISRLVEPSSIVLVESPTYHLAIRIFRDHDVTVVPVAADDGGLIVDEVAAVTRRLKRAGKRPAALYAVPTFGNPTGACLDLDRRMSLVRLAADENLMIIEDDPYRELFYEGPPPPSLWSLAPREAVIRLQSMSKTLAPGLRVGYLLAGPDTARQIVDSGVLDSGGGISHFSSLVVSEYMQAGHYDAHVERLRKQYRLRRDALAAGLSSAIPGLRLHEARGGYFLWGSLPHDADSSVFLPTAEQHGVSYLPGSTFFLESAPRSTFRVAFTRFEPAVLADAAGRLGVAFSSFMHANLVSSRWKGESRS